MHSRGRWLRLWPASILQAIVSEEARPPQASGGGAPASGRCEPVESVHIVRGDGKIKHPGVLVDPVSILRLRQDNGAFLQRPSDEYLRRDRKSTRLNSSHVK